MKHKLTQYKQYKEELSAELRKYVQDKNNSLDERFEALCECPELSERTNLTNFNLADRFNKNDKNYNDLLWSFYETCLFNFKEEIAIQDVLYSIKLEFAECMNLFSITPEEEITFKEYCCDNFISSMIFDW